MSHKSKQHIKSGFHLRNQHRQAYDFEKLTKIHPELDPYVAENKFGNLSLNFFDPHAVKLLNTILIKEYYNIQYWDIPEQYLTPAVPGRAEQIHRIADLMQKSNDPITCLDVGTGANLIYPIIGSFEYNWDFVAVDIDPDVLKNAKTIISKNPRLSGKIELRRQQNPERIFAGVVEQTDRFAVSICNPPFYGSQQEAIAATRRKVSNLTGKRHHKPLKNFGGSTNELWHDGGEVGFISRMITESVKFKDQIGWFTTLVSRETTLKQVINTLSSYHPKNVKTINMQQGNKISRILAWNF